LPDAEVPQAVEPALGHAAATYAGEADRAVGVWRVLGDPLALRTNRRRSRGQHPTPLPAFAAPDLLNPHPATRRAATSTSSAMDANDDATEARQVEVINTGEELLLKAKALARQIEERVRRSLGQHGGSTPHEPSGRENSRGPASTRPRPSPH
jgi:hypothetical protein